MANSRLEEGFWNLWRVTYRHLPQPEREYRFHDVRRWRLDFAWPDIKVGVEIDGGTSRIGGGRHNRPQGMDDDYTKANAAVVSGWSVFRITTGLWKREPVQQMEVIAAFVERKLREAA